MPRGIGQVFGVVLDLPVNTAHYTGVAVPEQVYQAQGVHARLSGASPSTGLRVTKDILDIMYKTGRKYLGVQEG